MTHPISFKSKSGSDVSGVIAEPAGTDSAPAVVVIQEFWGLNDHVKSLVDRMAKEGFLVIAPDLYHGKVTKDPAEATKLMTALDTLTAVGEIAGALAFAKVHPRSTGKVGVVGFCLGGALALASACHLPEVGATVSFYGLPPDDKVDYADVKAPVMMHVAQKDNWVTIDKASHVRDKIEAGGTHVDLHIYAANHAFMNDTRPDVYSEKDAHVAWENTVEFFKAKLV